MKDCDAKEDEPVFLVMAEVILGSMTRVRSCPYIESAFPGSKSTVVPGKLEPNPRKALVLPCGAKAAFGMEMVEAESIIAPVYRQWRRGGVDVPDHENELLEKSLQNATDFPLSLNVSSQWKAVITAADGSGYACAHDVATHDNQREKLQRIRVPRRQYLENSPDFHEFIVYDESQIRLRYLVQMQ